MTEAAVEFLEKSFLSPLLTREDVTDISFNGGTLFYVSNKIGRRRFEDASPTTEQVTSFLRQIANLTEKSINTAEPILDVSFGRYRLNGVNLSVGRFREKKAPSFSIRIASKDCKIEKDLQFMDESVRNILLSILKKRRSIVIGGQTGVGKTELQKWLLLNLPENTRVLVLDNVEELDMVTSDSIDMTTWIADSKSEKTSLRFLIKNALRHNPDYLIIAEARGEEMYEALASAGSGHPLITTIHADKLEMMPSRLVRLALMSDAEINYGELFAEVKASIPYYVYLGKASASDGSIKRFVRSIGHLNERSGQMELLYERREG